MQRQKTYRATVTLGSSVARDYSYGYTGTTTVYPSHSNWLNAKIAEFLTECGVEATWTNGGWLRIWGVPLFFTNNYNNNYLYTYVPYLSSTFFSIQGALPGNAYNGTELCITLYFTGTPTAFYLRFAGYSYLYPQSGACLRVVKGKNVLNNKDCVAMCGNTTTSTSQGPGNWYLYDIENDQVVSHSSTAYGAAVYTMCGIQHKEENPRAYPLVPVAIGPLYHQGLWMHPANMGLPDARTITEAAQTEVALGGRRFIITCADAGYNSAYVNMGMIELS